MSRRAWTKADDRALRRRYPHEKTATIAGDMGRSCRAVYARASLLGLGKSDEFFASPVACRTNGRQGIGTRFKPGAVPANKGLRRPGWAPGRMAETQFKKGELTGAAKLNYVPIGSHRISKDGYLERKVTDDPNIYPARRWVGVHRLVWEAANGAIPSGHAVVFRRGRYSSDPGLITADALELISRAELMRRNTRHNYGPEINQLYALKAALTRKINKHSGAGNEKQND